MKDNHLENCPAPICQLSKNKEAVWYPGEIICNLVPQKKFQKKQIQINKAVKEGKFKHLDKAYTILDL